MYRVLFVCLGNICRSPLGEGVLTHKVAQAGLDDLVYVDSCGTGGYHVGEPPHRESQRAARQRGVDISLQRARQVSLGDFAECDLILAMDRQNRRDLLAMETSGRYHDKVKLFMDFVPDAPGPDVPDPYYGGPEGFDAVYELIDRGCDQLLEHIRHELIRQGKLSGTKASNA